MQEEILRLYEIEANQVQEKIGHILTIRTLAVTVLATIIGGALVYPGKGFGFLSLILIPFYILESTYDAYLLPFVQRETVLRAEIAKGLTSHKDVANLYSKNLDHRITPERWNPFVRALLEPLRLGLYLILISVPIVLLT